MLVDYGICDHSIIQQKKPATADFLCTHNERKGRAADRQLCLIIYNYCVIDVIPSIAMSNAGADKITPLNDKVVAEGTEEKVKEVEDALIDGSLHVFDTSTFTVDGKELTTYKKDGSDTEYISDGYFHESEYGSAPAFDIAIDGITSITQ